MNWQLVITDGARKGQTHAGTDSVTLGRSTQCDLAIDDASISQQHARIRVEGDTLLLEDLDSTNGTELNGSDIHRAELTQGDILVVGDTPLRVDIIRSPGVSAAANAPQRSPSRSTRPMAVVAVALLVALALGALFHVMRKTESPATPSASSNASATRDAPAVPTLTLPPVPAYEQVSKQEWNQRYALPYGGWFDSKTPDNARKNYLYVGPLGIRTLAHVRERMPFEGFAAVAPRALQDETGYLLVNCLEILYVAPGSPADGHLQEGDLVLAINGDPLLSGDEYRPDTPFPTKAQRTLKMHVGDAIDSAEAIGTIKMRVLRIPATREEPLPRPPKQRTTLHPATRLAGAQRDQTIEVSVDGMREIMLIVGDGGDQIHGDSTLWIEPTFIREDGSEQLGTKQPWLRANCGYGSVRVIETPEGYESLSGGTPRRNSIATHSVSEITYRVPDDAVRFRVTVRRPGRGRIAPTIDGIKRNAISAIPEATLAHTADIEIPLPRIGSFAKHYPGNCPKSDWIVQQNINWLLAQQRPNGAWPRWGGYTSDIFDTAIVGLALLTTGDPKLDDPIRRAAHHVAYEGSFDHWGTPRATALLFLAEYYLRTQDASILAGLEQAYHRVSETMLIEGFVGHGTRLVGYGYGGVCLSTGHAAAALAVTSKTPVPMDPGALQTILRNIAALSVDGSLPYGRVHAAPRKGTHGQRRGGYAPTGPALAGAIIGGGSERFIRDATQMYRDSLGYGDIAHSSQTIGWWGTTYGLPIADRDTFHAHMEIFKHKITLLRCWEGGFLANEFPFDYMGAEGVMGGIFRTAVYVLTLCADRQNLAITGKPEHLATTHLQQEPSHNWDHFTWRYYLRNWAVADAILEHNSPPELRATLTTLKALPPGDTLHRRLFALLESHAGTVMDAIMRIPDLSAETRAHAVELILGLDFRVHTDADDNNVSNQTITVSAYWPLREKLRWSGDAERKTYAAAPMFPVKGSLALLDPDGVLADATPFKVDSTKGGSDSRDFLRKLSRTVTVRDRVGEFSLPMRIRYTVGPHQIDYVRDLPFNRPGLDVGRSMHSGDRRIRIKGQLVRDMIGQEVLLRLRSGVALGLMTPESHKTALPLQTPDDTWTTKGQWGGPQEGDRVTIDYVSADIHIGVCMRMIVEDSAVRRLTPRSLSWTQTDLALPDDPAALYDSDLGTAYRIQRPARGQTNLVLTVALSEIQPLNGLGLWADGVGRVQVLADGTDAPTLLYSGPVRHTLRFPTIDTQHLTLRLTAHRNISLKELKLTHNPRRTSGEKWGSGNVPPTHGR